MTAKTAAEELMRCGLSAGKVVVPVKLRDRIVDYLLRMGEPQPEAAPPVERRVTGGKKVSKKKAPRW